MNRSTLADVANYAARRNSTDFRSMKDSQRRALVVSWSGDKPISRLTDTIWDFQYEASHSTQFPCQMRINFDLRFHDGSRLIEDRHSALLYSTQCFLAAVTVTTSEQLGRRRKPITIYQSTWSRLKVLLRWMVSQGFSQFEELTKKRCALYLRHLSSMTNQRSVDGSATPPLDPRTIRGYAQIIDVLWSHRAYVTDALPEMPWRTSAVARAIGCYRRTDPIDAIPQNACIQLISAALKYVEQLAPNIIDAERAFHATYNADRPTSMVALRSDWRELSKYGYSSVHEYRLERRSLRTACAIVILFFSGMRESELVSLGRDCYFETEDPEAGTLCWVRGHTYKGRPFPEPCNWMVPEIVGAAIRSIELLTQPLHAMIFSQMESSDSNTSRDADSERHRQREALNRLFVTQKKRGKAVLPLPGAVLRDDVASFGRQIGLEDDSGSPWPLNVMQFRRTFACLVASHSLGDLRYLREHFKHWSIDQTAYYAHGAMRDDTLLEHIREQRCSLQSALIDSWMDPSSRLAGGAGATIGAWRESARRIRTADSRAAIVDSISKDVVIRGTGHSYCLTQGYGCGGQGLYDAIRCGNCKDSVIDATLARTWLQLREQQIELLATNDCGVAMSERGMQHLRMCDEVLTTLGVLNEISGEKRGAAD